MKIVHLLLSFFFFWRSTSSIISSSPGLQRRNIGESCHFQWTINGQISKYDLLNMSSITPTPLLSDHSNRSMTTIASSSSSIIRLFIWNIRLWDAGNYSLSVTQGTTTTTDAGALLFVYDDSGTSSVTHNGTLPVPEEGSVALSCAVTTDSRPSSHRPAMRFFWELEREGVVTRSDEDGHVTLRNGQILRRYDITDDGRTLVIGALHFSDQRSYFCSAQEDGSVHRTDRSSGLHLLLNHRPVVTAWKPPSRKFNADSGQLVSLSLWFEARPTISTPIAWTLTDVNGTVRSVPSEFHRGYSLSSPFAVTFTLTSDALYGRYSFVITNSMGSYNGSFSVLPPGRPDAPSAMTVQYKTFRLISIEWKCQWNNGRQQTAMLQLKDVQRDEVLDTFNRTETDDSCYNDTRSHLFQKHLQEDTDYEISLRSDNDLGPSDAIIKMTVRTTRRFQLLLSHSTISVDENEARISFETRHGNMAVLTVTCCAEETDECTSDQFQVNTSTGYVILKDLPPGMAYLFDFKAFGKAPGGEEYFLGMIKGVRVPEDGDQSDGCIVAVVVLGCLLAIFLFASLSLFVFVKIRGNKERKRNGSTDVQDNNEETELKPRQTKEKTKEKTKTEEQRQQQRPTNEQPKPQRPLPDPKTPRKSQVPPPRMPPPEVEEYAQETYEAMERAEETKAGDDGETYTPLDQPQPTRKQKINLYS